MVTSAATVAVVVRLITLQTALTASAFMLDDTQLKQIVYALTLNAANCPPAAPEVANLCGQIPQRGPDMGAHFNQCGHDALLALWKRLISTNPDVSTFADGEWAIYQQRISQPMPSLAACAMNVASAVASETAAIVKSEPPVFPEEAQRRFAICEQCVCFKPDDARCSKCGCYMRVKTTFRTATCPEGKWVVDTASSA
jgi:hypothetical protein